MSKFRKHNQVGYLTQNYQVLCLFISFPCNLYFVLTKHFITFNFVYIMYFLLLVQPQNIGLDLQH